MSIKITYFVHCSSLDNKKGVSSGWFDSPLSEEGVQQSAMLKEKTKNKKFDVVFCSDLTRAIDSAQLAFNGVAPIQSDRRLRECNYGELNGQPTDVVEPLQEKHITEKFPGGESYEDVKHRVSDFLAFLKKNHDGKNVALVAHKGPQLSLDVLLRGKTWKEAFAEDWRKTKSWQPGWEYNLD